MILSEKSTIKILNIDDYYNVRKKSNKNLDINKSQWLSGCYHTRFVFAHHPESHAPRSWDFSREVLITRQPSEEAGECLKSSLWKWGLTDIHGVGGARWSEVWRRMTGGEERWGNWWSVQASQTPCLFIGPMFTKWWH